MEVIWLYYFEFLDFECHWLNVVFRTPYFARKICDGSYARADIQKKIRQMYDDSLETDGSDFVGAVTDALSDFYDFQRLTKRVSSGELLS